jgi:plastocyanin
VNPGAGGCVSPVMRLTTQPGHRTAIALASLVLLGSMAAACGSDDDDSGSDDPTTTAPGDGGSAGSGEEGTIVAEDFSLTDLTVAPGAEISLQNDGEAPHTATADDDSFDLGEVAAGETSDPGAAPTTPGDYAFHCEIHPNMTATLTVEG